MDPLFTGDDLVINATIGGTTAHTLIDVPTDVEVLHLEGFFDAITPDVPPAFFDIIIGVMNDASVDAFTYFLPTQTSSSLFQITDLGSDLTSEIDNIDIFVDGSHPVVARSMTDPSLAGLSVITLDNGVDNQWFVGTSPVNFSDPTGAVNGIGAPAVNCGFITTTVQRHGRTTTIQTPAACPVPEPSGISLFGLALFLGAGVRILPSVLKNLT